MDKLDLYRPKGLDRLQNTVFFFQMIRVCPSKDVHAPLYIKTPITYKTTNSVEYSPFHEADFCIVGHGISHEAKIHYCVD
jgi:hypothetical protein